MAKLVSTRRTPWVRGPTAVVDAMVLGAVSLNHDVYFERVVAYTAFVAKGAHAIIDPIGAAIDTVINAGTAIGAAFVQETTAGGTLPMAQGAGQPVQHGGDPRVPCEAGGIREVWEKQRVSAVLDPSRIPARMHGRNGFEGQRGD